MDAYNRGYEAGIELPTIIGTTYVGDAKIISSVADNNTEARDIGFYALAYQMGTDTIISYRGTDYPEEDTTIPRPMIVRSDTQQSAMISLQSKAMGT